MGMRRQRGLTLVELLLALALSAVLLVGFGQLYLTAAVARTQIETRRELMRDARFALNRMIDAVQETDRLILPMADSPRTSFAENVRGQTVPASPPQSGSSMDTAVLAVAVSANQDMDLDGVPDADNDGDGLINEDWGGDVTNDGANGIRGIDDTGDGNVDPSFFGITQDDDEYLNFPDEDPVNGIDDDRDGMIDEDSGADMNGDWQPGVSGIDDDGDGSIDEGDRDDDDEDGLIDEDWLDPVVFYLVEARLVEARPAPWDTNLDSLVDGRDRLVRTIADDVTRLRFERIAGATNLVGIELELSRDGESVSLRTRVRAGASL